MKKYKYKNVTITATSESEADLKMQSLAILGKHLKAHELAKLAEVVQKDPVKTSIAKKALGL